MTDLLTVDTPELPLLEITPRRSLSFRIGEVWRYHELLYFLVWRDVKVRYKQTALGVIWAVAQPLGMMLVFTIFLGRLAHVPSNGIPYPLFVLSALLPWQLFAAGLNESANSLVANERLITKVYFPRVIVPAAAVLSAFVDFAIGFLILIAITLSYGVAPTANLVFAPLFVLLAIVASLGAGFWLSALNVRYRDVRYVLTFLTQLWLFITPVVYPATIVPERWRTLFALNPMAGVIEGFRWSVAGGPPPAPHVLLASGIGILILFAGGIVYFNRMDDTFADVI